ncbi:MAG: hypothetical protein IJA86_02410 [Clostridia bacterium]|nr:hypothetical protein [Clostridia bacterium]
MSIFLILQIIHFFLMRNVAFSLFSYICIITSCLFCILLSDGSKAYLYTQIGLIGTVGADFFLVFLPFQLRVPGMICFCATQLAYFLRTYSEDENPIRKKVHFILRIAVSVLSVAVTGIVLGSRIDALSLISVFYYAHLLLNVIFSFVQFKKLHILAIALFMFIISDTLIGFDNLSSYLLIPRGSIIYIIMRLGKSFLYPLYIASQIMIPLSMVPRKRKALQRKTTE